MLRDSRRKRAAKLYVDVLRRSAITRRTSSADSAVSALEATKLILARAQSLEAVPDDAKKAASLDGLN